MRPDESYAAPAEIRLLQRCRQDSPRQRLLACYEEVDAMTRILSAALVTTLVFAHLAAAQPSGPTEPSGTRLLVGPTARALEQGQFYVDFSAFVGGPFAQVGVTDRVSIGAGTPVLVPGIQPGGVMVVTPKVQVYAGRNVDASVGVLQFLGPQVTQPASRTPSSLADRSTRRSPAAWVSPTAASVAPMVPTRRW
jgi:hypothetical protein